MKKIVSQGVLSMFCGNCGTQNPDTNSFCKNCGSPLIKQQTAVPVVPAPVPAVAVQLGQQIPVKKGRNWPGIMSAVAGITGFLIYPYILGALAVVLGGYSIYTTHKKTGKTAVIAVAGIIIGITAMLLNYFYIFIF
jgi:hypothetical protein